MSGRAVAGRLGTYVGSGLLDSVRTRSEAEELASDAFRALIGRRGDSSCAASVHAFDDG